MKFSCSTGFFISFGDQRVELDDKTVLRVTDAQGFLATEFAGVRAAAGETARARCVALVLQRLLAVAGVRALVADLDDGTAAVAFAWLGRALLARQARHFGACAPGPQPDRSYNVSFVRPVFYAEVPPLSDWWVADGREPGEERGTPRAA